MKRTGVLALLVALTAANWTYSVGLKELAAVASGAALANSDYHPSTKILAALTVANTCTAVEVIPAVKKEIEPALKRIELGANPAAEHLRLVLAGVVLYPIFFTVYSVELGAGYLAGWALR